jgi:acetoacetate decarboxylase
METSHPPAPWRLHGDAVIVPFPVRARDDAVPDGATALRGPGGRSLGGLLLAAYGAGSTLAYHELIAFSGLARAGGRVGFVVSHIAVDAPASVTGGRELWGLPKRLADFAWTPREIAVAEDGVEVVRARVAPAPVRAPVLVLAPFFGGLGHSVARGRMRVAPALVDLDVPPGSPLRPLGLVGRRPGFEATGIELLVPAPRPGGR